MVCGDENRKYFLLAVVFFFLNKLCFIQFFKNKLYFIQLFLILFCKVKSQNSPIKYKLNYNFKNQTLKYITYSFSLFH
jgi:hypothetical protein